MAMSGNRAGLVAAGALAGVLAVGAAGYSFAAEDRGPATDPAAARFAAPAPPDPATTAANPAANPSATTLRADPLAVRPSPPPSKPSSRKTPTATVTNCADDRRQRDVEAWLSTIGGYGPVTVDGVQSAADCAAIMSFQQRFGIKPVTGHASATTADVARRIATSMSPARRAECGAGAGVTACVDLTLQTVWVVRDGAVVFGPTVVRTGFRGHATPAGTFRINKRTLKEWSDPYDVWLPYWQRFHRGMGFHETTTYLHNSAIGSHGCVNLLRADAQSLWRLLDYGGTVRTFGRRAGT